jgi:hypothetical protein
MRCRNSTGERSNPFAFLLCQEVALETTIRSATVSRAGRDQPQQYGGAMGVKSFHASGDGHALRLVAATQPLLRGGRIEPRNSLTTRKQPSAVGVKSL